MTAEATAKKGGVVGVWSSTEPRDSIKTIGGVGSLAEIFTASLLRRDSVIWNRRQFVLSMLTETDGSVIASGQSFVEPYRPNRSTKIEHRTTACHRCGGFEFYAGGSCRECLRVKNAKIKAAKKAAKKAAPVIEFRPGLRDTQIKRPHDSWPWRASEVEG